jgi:hypothetical protein
MSDILLLVTLGVMTIAIFFDMYRVWQFNKYLKQNKKILAEMEAKRKEIYELSILFNRIEEINETINNTKP